MSMPTYRRITRITAFASLSLFALAGAAFVLGLRINTTHSIPRGVYWTIDAPVAPGAYVVFCPPAKPVFATAAQRGYIARGPCASGYGHVMKRVLAAKGDAVAVRDDGVYINDGLLPNSAPLATDGEGRTLPRYRIEGLHLDGADVLLMGDASKASFDGRYFGPIKRSQITAVIRPVVTW